MIILDKKEGETPLEALGAFHRKHPKFKDVPMTYAGRLDPMASGLLIILVGEECKKKEKYLKLSKEYEFEVLFGFATDTHDILGKVQYSHILQNTRMFERDLVSKIKKNLKYFKGKFKQKYPAYSSKTVAGKQLWQYARAGEEVEAPEREVEVKSLKFLGIRKVNYSSILQNTTKRIKKVKGDFRQKEILRIWQKTLKGGGYPSALWVAKFKIKCSSGTYVRSIAHELGEKMGIPALAYSIKRNKIGKYTLIKSK